jgi:hypothetical protein
MGWFWAAIGAPGKFYILIFRFSPFFRLIGLAPREFIFVWAIFNSGESPHIISPFLGLPPHFYQPHLGSFVLISTPLRVPPHPRVPIALALPYPDSATLRTLFGLSTRSLRGLSMSFFLGGGLFLH